MKEQAKEIIKKAVKNGITDIYLLPWESKYKLIYKNLNGYKESEEVEQAQAQQLIAHYKFTAGMNVGEKRRTQLGSCHYDTGEGVMRLRLSSVGDFEGKESLVIRLLKDFSINPEFWLDGFAEARNMLRGRGLYLFAGPVGSGKTTLMYALAKEKFSGKQVISIEDPVEIVDPEFLQLQRNEIIGSSYDELIKLSLRHMADLIIVGEIRDELTARAVLRASLTGYTVFSTVHANSISGSVKRLVELGLNKNQISDALKGVVYQRLIGGKGLIDIRTEGFVEYENTKWNNKIDQLVNSGYLTGGEAQTEKIIS